MPNRPRRFILDHPSAIHIFGIFNLFWSLILVWTSFGLAVAVVIAIGLNYVLLRLTPRKDCAALIVDESLNC